MSKGTDRQSLPEWARQFFDTVELFGFHPRFEHDYPTPDFKKRVQVRAEKHVAPPAEVRKYAEAMRRGEKFPPIVMTKDGYTVDGATRIGAALKNKFPGLPALVLDESFEGASEQSVQRFVGLGAAFNLRNGKGIDRAEIRKAIERLGANRAYDATRIAALLGVTEAVVRAIMQERRARERAARLNIVIDGNINASQLKAVGRAEKSINDGPFAELLSLIQDAGLSTKEIADLVKKIKAAKSDDAAIQILEDDREARHEQIAMKKATGGKTITPNSSKLRQHLGFVLKFMNGHAHEAVERNPALHGEHLRVVENSILALQHIAEHQRAQNDAA
jgi:hypothetical protein